MKQPFSNRIGTVFVALHALALLLPVMILLFMPAPQNMPVMFWLLICWLSLALTALAWWLRKRQQNKVLQQIGEILAGCTGISSLQPIDAEALPKDAPTREFVDAFNGVASKITSCAQLFTDAATKLAEQATQLSNIASQIEQRMREQVSRTGEVHAVISELQQAVSVAADTAAQANKLASKSESEGNSGKVVMTEAMTGVMMMSGSVKEAGEIIKTLGEDSKSIGGIIEVITGVADQTNLLALNAAIEAARAGEQGRGFAVVADEVRKLASQTQDSAQKIKSIIGNLLGHVGSAGDVVAKAGEYSNKSDELMEGVVVSYSEIVGYMVQISVIANILAQATAQGNASATSSNEQLGAIQSAAEETIGMANDLVMASKELGKMGQQLNILAGGSAAGASDVELF